MSRPAVILQPERFRVALRLRRVSLVEFTRDFPDLAIVAHALLHERTIVPNSLAMRLSRSLGVAREWLCGGVE
jgi:hypothetical protein